MRSRAKPNQQAAATATRPSAPARSAATFQRNGTVSVVRCSGIQEPCSFFMELLRQGGERFAPGQDEELLHQVAKQVAKTTQRAIQSIDKALAMVAQSEARIQALNKTRKKH